MDEAGWTPTSTHLYRIRSHPQETTENTIDLNHLRFLNEKVGQVGKSELVGPHFRTGFRFEGTYNVPILRKLRFELAATVDIWGLGFLFVDTLAPTLGVRTMNWFLTTPIDGEHVDILVSAKVRALARFEECLRLVPGGLRQRLLHPLVMYEFKKNIEKDFMVWDNKVYAERPLLNRADGEIMKFRNYCTQFYPEYRPRAARAGRPGRRAGTGSGFRSRVRLTPRGSWPAGRSRKGPRCRTDSHNPGTPRRKVCGRRSPTPQFPADSPDSSAPRRRARSAGSHRWYGRQAPSRRSLATTTSHPARDAAGGAAPGCRNAARRRCAFDASCSIAHHLHAPLQPAQVTTATAQT